MHKSLREYSMLSNESNFYDNSGRRIKKNQISFKMIFFSLRLYLYEAFLPRGYPKSVSDDYMSYQIWDSLQAFCSTLSGMLAVQSVLLGVGVGQANATPLAAAVTWFTKDGIGMISGITFAWLKGTSLDADCKKWRLFADFVNDIALCIELSISYWKMNAIFLLCVSSALKAVVGVAGGATRAVVTQHQAIRGNTADVAAKDGSQETLVNLVTMVFGLGFIHLEFTQRWAWILMLGLVIFHLYFNYRAVRSLNLRTVNEERFFIILSFYQQTGKILSVAEVNSMESVFVGLRKKFRNFSLKIGQSLSSVRLDFEKIESGANFLIFIEKDKKLVTIGLKNGISDYDIFRAYFEAVYQFTGENVDIESVCLDFWRKAESSGWEVNSALLPVGPWRYEFNKND